MVYWVLEKESDLLSVSELLDHRDSHLNLRKRTASHPGTPGLELGVELDGVGMRRSRWMHTEFLRLAERQTLPAVHCSLSPRLPGNGVVAGMRLPK